VILNGNVNRLFIGGAWVTPSGTDRIDVVSPATEQVIASVPAATPSDMDRAVAAAREAFDHGPWPRMAVPERIEVLQRYRDLWEKNTDTMAELISREMGCPITPSRIIQATTPRVLLEGILDTAQRYEFSTLRRSAAGTALVTREPVGVVAAIVPWNVPQCTTMVKVAPALLAGCTMIVKPAPETPLDAYLMAEMLHEAGVPDGVINVVPAERETSEYLVTHPGVDKVTFTGSTAAGRRIASLCGNALRRVTLELGGKSAAVFLDDADFDAGVEALRFGSLRNSGQVCSLKTRLVVSRRRESDLTDRLLALLESMPVGDPADPATQVGPMAGARHRERVERYIESGRTEGARLLAGGGRPAGLDRGWYVEPTVFSEVAPYMRIAQDEIFGPVLSVLSYDTEDEAISIANDSVYGLNGAVFTSDLDHGLEVARRIRTGTVELNGSPAGVDAPTGGVKCSGIGRELGAEGLEEYIEFKSVGLPLAYADQVPV
jgi:aldehyde dehydrogenase (NAD+)